MNYFVGSIISIIVGYLLGGVPAAVVISKSFKHSDIRGYGSGNAGATNMLRTFGWGPALLTFVVDTGKGALAVLIGWLLAREAGMLLCGFFVVVGHVLPIFAGFRGGKGVSTTLGVLLAIHPLIALILLAVFILIVAATRYISLGSVVAISLLPVLGTIFAIGSGTFSGWELLQQIGLVLITLMCHRENIIRLRNGQERKLGSEKSSRVR